MKNEGLCYSLLIIGWSTIFLGVVGAIILMVEFNKSSLFEAGGHLSDTEVYLTFGILFYHIVFGTISLGVGKILESSSSSTDMSSYSNSSQSKCTHSGETGNYCTQCGIKIK